MYAVMKKTSSLHMLIRNSQKCMRLDRTNSMDFSRTYFPYLILRLLLNKLYFNERKIFTLLMSGTNLIHFQRNENFLEIIKAMPYLNVTVLRRGMRDFYCTWKDFYENNVLD